MLILAGVTISTLTGNSGITTKAQNAKKMSKVSSEKEAIQLAVSLAKMEKYLDENNEYYIGTPLYDKTLENGDKWDVIIIKDTLEQYGTDWCYVVPGNYGMDFLRKKLHVDTALSVKCSNYVGETIEDAKLLGMKGILLIGHIGKFIKLAAGVMNTHSRQADCRMEVVGVHAAMNGADAAVVREIMDCINTTEAMEILRREKLIEPVMESVMKRIEFFLKNRAGEELEIGVILFSTEDGILGKSENADELLKKIQENR